MGKILLDTKKINQKNFYVEIYVEFYNFQREAASTQMTMV